MPRLKRTSGGLVWLISLLAVSSVAAQGPERVVLLEEPGQPSRTELIQALRIQLSGVAALDVRQMPAESSGLSERIHAASQLAEAPDALVVVWAEPTMELEDGSREAVLYVVGRTQGRALVEVVRVQGGDSPDVDRSVALKVRDLVYEVQRNRAAAPQNPELGLEEPAAPSATTPTPAPAPPPAAAPWGLTAAGGVAIGTLSGLGQWGLALAGGATFDRDPLRLSGRLELRWFPELTAEGSGASEARLSEVAPGLLLRAQWRTSALRLGLRAGIALSFLDADAASARGVGDDAPTVTSLLAGPELELPIAAGFGLSAALELQVRLRRQRYTVLGEELIDLGRVRPLLLLALTWNAADAR
jgi:hypothetical protein